MFQSGDADGVDPIPIGDYVGRIPAAVKEAAAGRLPPEEWLARRQRPFLAMAHRPDDVKDYGHATRGKSKSSLFRAMIAPCTKGGCWYCSKFLGKYGEDGGIDHLTPTSRGGTSRATNLVLCCHKCNNRKGSKTLEEYRAHLGGNMKKSAFKFWGEVCLEERKRRTGNSVGRVSV